MTVFDCIRPADGVVRGAVATKQGHTPPGSHRRFAGYLTHATHKDPDKYPALYYSFLFMTSLLVGTFVIFGLHTIAWLPRSWKLRHEIRDTFETSVF